MKIIKENYTFLYNWNKVSTAYWLKYPNPYNTTIIAVDIIDRKLLNDGMLYTQRLITTNTNVPIPNFIRNYFNINKFYIIENSLIDLQNKKTVIVSYNISYKNLIKSYEHVEYLTLNNNNTLMTQEISIDITAGKYCYGYGTTYFENKALNIIKNNILSGRLGMNYILQLIT